MGWGVGREPERQTQGECPPAGKLFLEHQQALLRKTGVGREGGERLPPRPDPQVHQVHVLPSKLPHTFCQWFPYYVVFSQPLVSFFTVFRRFSGPSPLFSCFLAAKFQSQCHILSFCYSSFLFLIPDDVCHLSIPA